MRFVPCSGRTVDAKQRGRKSESNTFQVCSSFEKSRSLGATTELSWYDTFVWIAEGFEDSDGGFVSYLIDDDTRVSVGPSFESLSKLNL